MWVEWILGLWTAAGWTWWLLSLKLVFDTRSTPVEFSPEHSSERQLLSIFKPLPRLNAGGLGEMEAGLVSFVAQLDDRSELLLGVHAVDRGRLALFLQEMEIRFPKANLRVVTRSDPDQYPNPKIAWEVVLAKEAQGELWLWSDADIFAPAGFLERARSEFAARQATLLTFPYLVVETTTTPGFLDALFVNADFYPGVLLLRKLQRADFGLGAGLLFRRDDFLARVKWNELGAEIADDFYLGQKLGPVGISSATVTTTAGAGDWRLALAHYLRWSKTIRWNRPGGAAARITVLPLAGWTAAVLIQWNQTWTWLGWFTVWQVDVLAALLLCRWINCPIGWKDIIVSEGWAFWRIVAWAACWVPVGVQWGGVYWSGPRKVRGQH